MIFSRKIEHFDAQLEATECFLKNGEKKPGTLTVPGFPYFFPGFFQQRISSRLSNRNCWASRE